MKTQNLITDLNDLLAVKLFRDYAPNGLQIEGKTELSRVLTAVSASEAAIDAAIEYGADALLVHHGYFWKNESPELIGIKRARIHKLLTHNINLIAYHLPLDQHIELGNNIGFGNALGAQNISQSTIENLIWHGEITPQTPEQFSEVIRSAVNRMPIMVGKVRTPITRIAWCTGSAQDYLVQAAKEGAQAFLSGEYAERTYHEANELGILYYSCGHHATETFGVRKMAQWIAKNYGLTTAFFDEPNPF